LLHAKNIRRDFGVPIWFSSTDAGGNAVPFVQLVYLWATISARLDDDPFLSYRMNDRLNCLLYKQIQSAVQSAAQHFGLIGNWFNTQSIRMSAPTIAASVNAQTKIILQMGRWASEPSALLYQHQSTAVNSSMLSVIQHYSHLMTSSNQEYWHRALQGNNRPSNVMLGVIHRDSMYR
jgi:hypothetical protein